MAISRHHVRCAILGAILIAAGLAAAHAAHLPVSGAAGNAPAAADSQDKPLPGLAVRFRLVEAGTGQPFVQKKDGEVLGTVIGAGTYFRTFAAEPAASGEAGAFTIQGLPLDGLTLSIATGAHLPVECNIRDRKPGPQDNGFVDLGTIKLERRAFVRGVFVDPKTGQPVADKATVTGNCQTSTNGSATVQFAWLEAPGAFEARWSDKVQAVPADLWLAHPGYAPHEFTNLPQPDAMGCIDVGKVTLESGRHLEGVLVDEKGEPVGAAEIVAKGPLGRWSATRTAVSKENGAFSLDGLWPQTFAMSVTHDKRIVGRVDDLVVADKAEAEAVRLVVHTDGTLRGRLVDLLGRPLAGWAVTVHAADAEPRFVAGRQLVTSGIGEFEVALPDTPSRLHVEHSVGESVWFPSRYIFDSAPLAGSRDLQVFTVPLADGLDLGIRAGDVALPPRIEARLRMDGRENQAEPEPGTMRLNSVDIQSLCGVEDGHIRVPAVPVGVARLEISGEGIAKTEVAKLEMRGLETMSGGDIEIAKAPQPFTFRLLNKETQNPPANLQRLAIRSMMGPGSWGQMRPDNVTVAPDGTISIKVLEPATKAFAVDVPKCASLEIPVAANGNHDLGTFSLEPGLTYRASLVGANDNQRLPPGVFFSDKMLIGQREGETQPLPGVMSVPGMPAPGDDSERGDTRWNNLPLHLGQVTIQVKGYEPYRVESVPAPDANGVVQLGQIALKPLPGQPAPGGGRLTASASGAQSVQKGPEMRFVPAGAVGAVVMVTSGSQKIRMQNLPPHVIAAMARATSGTTVSKNPPANLPANAVPAK